MRKETPSTDVGRVLIIGELRRKQTIGGRGGLLQSDLRFTRHKPSLVINLHVALRGWEKKNHEAEQNTEPRVSVRHKLHGRGLHIQTQRIQKKKEKKRTLWLQEALFYTYVFYIVLPDYEGKRKESPSVNEVRFTDSLE